MGMSLARLPNARSVRGPANACDPISASFHATFTLGSDELSTWWWRVEYVVGSGVTEVDTVSFAVGLKGNPAQLIS